MRWLKVAVGQIAGASPPSQPERLLIRSLDLDLKAFPTGPNRNWDQLVVGKAGLPPLFDGKDQTRKTKVCFVIDIGHWTLDIGLQCLPYPRALSV